MKTFNSLSHKTPAAVLIAAMLSVGATPAVAQQQYEGSGVVGPARCAEAAIFKDQSGKSYELDNSRVVLPKGVPLTIHGNVYQRISVCKVFPWLDVTTTSLGSAASKVGADPINDSMKRGDGAVVVRLEMSEIGAASGWISQLAARDDISRIHIQLSESSLEALPDLILGLGPAGPEMMKKMDIAATTGRPEFAWTVNGRKRVYKSTMELRNALFN